MSDAPSDPEPAGPVRATDAMIAAALPDRRPGVYVFVSLADPARGAALASRALASIREDEGLSLVLPRDLAAAEGFDCALPMACITLRVASALDGVGLTAAVAGALAAESIPANVIAAFHHDHVLVPEAEAERAIAILHALAARYRAAGA